jgi:hypothetical protein
MTKNYMSSVLPALGAAELESRIDFFGEGCLSGEVALHLGASS